MKELCFDFSTWNDSLDYNEVRKLTDKVIIRGGFSTTKDNRFDKHYNNLQGINLGVYWFCYATTPEEARREARKCLEVIEGKQFTLPIFLDMEDDEDCGYLLSQLGRDRLDAIVTAFGEVIEGAGYYFGVYTNLDWYRNILSGSELNQKYDWWIAAWYDGEEGPSGVNYGIWQFTSNYYIAGDIVDANYVYKDYPTIIREAGLNHLGGEPTPTPTPTPEPTDDFKVGDRVLVTGYATEDSYGNGNRTADYGGNPNDPEDIRYITAINQGATRPYHISVGNTLGDGDRGWVSSNQIRKI